MISGHETDTAYRVEISGWDCDEDFFVEKSDLVWGPDQVKRTIVRRRLREGSIVFVRLLVPAAYSNSYPIAYQVSAVNPKSGSNCWEMELVQLKPRHREKIAHEHDCEIVRSGESR